MRCDPNIIGAKATVEAQQAFISGYLLETVKHAPVGQGAVRTLRLLLQPGLDKVKGQAEEAGEEACDRGGRQRLSTRREGGGAQAGLGFAEEGQLSEVQSHRSYYRGRAAGPEGRDAFGSGDSQQRVDDGRIVCTLARWLQAIALHANESKVSRVAHDSCKSTGR